MSQTKLLVGGKLVDNWRDAIARSDCLVKASGMGHDPEAAQRICDAISEDAPNVMDRVYGPKGPVGQGHALDKVQKLNQLQKKQVPKSAASNKMVENCVKAKIKADDSLSEEDATQDCQDAFEKKSGWFDPTKGLSEVEPEETDNEPDLPEEEAEDEEESADIQQDYGENLGYTKDKGNTHDLGNDGPKFDSIASLDGNDHIDTHMSQDQKDMYNTGLDTDVHDPTVDAEDISNDSDIPDLPDDQTDDEQDQQTMKVKTVMPDFKGPIISGQSGADEEEQKEDEDESPEEEDTEDENDGKSNNNKKKSSTRKAKRIYKNAQVEPFESNGRFFVKAFLLDTSLNQNNWGVSPQTLDANITSYVGKPLVLTEKFDHPDSGDPNLDHALLYQELYRIGSVTDVVKNGTRYDAVCEITDPYAIDAWRMGEIPLYVSPQLYKQDASESDRSISKWQGTHLALVKDPAFGVKVATFGGSCTGDPDTCLAQLKKASIIEKHGYGSCGYCNRKLLLSAKVSPLQHNSPENEPKINYPPGYSSLERISDSQARNKVPDPLKQSSAVVELDAANKKIASLEQKLAIALNSNKEKDSVNSDLAKRMAALETEHRRDKVAAILSAAGIVEKEGFDERVSSLAKSNLPLEEIHSIYQPYVEAKNAGLNLKGASNTTQTEQATGKKEVQYVESKVTMKNAATEAAAVNQKPAWLSTRDYLMEGVT